MSKAADLARELGIPITQAAARLRGERSCPLMRAKCVRCSADTAAGRRNNVLCPRCREEHRGAAAAASLAIRRAVRLKEMLPASALKCVDCGDQARVYDHRDYSRPLDVQPVCLSCNVQRGLAQSPMDGVPASSAVAPLAA